MCQLSSKFGLQLLFLIMNSSSNAPGCNNVFLTAKAVEFVTYGACAPIKNFKQNYEKFSGQNCFKKTNHRSKLEFNLFGQYLQNHFQKNCFDALSFIEVFYHNFEVCGYHNMA